MIEVTRTQLLPGVHLTAVQTQKFKSSVLGMQFLLPLAREQAALHALLPMVRLISIRFKDASIPFREVLII